MLKEKQPTSLVKLQRATNELTKDMVKPILIVDDFFIVVGHNSSFSLALGKCLAASEHLAFLRLNRTLVKAL